MINAKSCNPTVLEDYELTHDWAIVGIDFGWLFRGPRLQPYPLLPSDWLVVSSTCLRWSCHSTLEDVHIMMSSAIEAIYILDQYKYVSELSICGYHS